MTSRGRAWRRFLVAVAALGGLGVQQAGAQAVDTGPPDLPGLPEASTPAPVPTGAKPLRIALEAALGRVDLRRDHDERDLRRAAVDLRYERTSGPWRFYLSDRLDDTHPVPLGQRSTQNSLRELLVGWNGESASVEAGRINLRHGPAFGYNPTDYFRETALRTITTADPVALRENRLGTVMLRGTWSSPAGTAALAVAPELQDERSSGSMSADLWRTNRTDRMLASFSASLSERFSGQVLAFGERGRGVQFGVNATSLLGDALVGFVEASTGRDTNLLQESLGLSEPQRRLHRASVGATYTFATRLSVTVEGEYNGAGLDRNQHRQLLRSGPGAQLRFLELTQSSMEIGSRRAWVVHVAQPGAFLKNLDLSGFVRGNAVDRSRLVWAEARYHWSQFDAVLQWQRFSGRADSEFGTYPYRQVLQVMGVWYF
jgi:hypothetical protein